MIDKPQDPKNSALILVIDDDRIMRRLIRQAMEREGYRVVEACDGQEGLELYKTKEPDLILLDAMMPVMDGFTCCQVLHRLTAEKILINNHYHLDVSGNDDSEDMLLRDTRQLLGSVISTPILMITGLNDATSVNRAFEVGATDYITKPIHWAVLKQRVKRLLQQVQLYHKLEEVHLRLQYLATVDGLTQLANRRLFEDFLQREWRLMHREQRFLSLIFCDLDFFKRYNDTYGHQAGDYCLQQVAKAIAKEAKRPTDLVARYGGEELVIILSNTDMEGAKKVTARIQANVWALEIEHQGSTVSEVVTLSLGVASLIPQDDMSPRDLIELADQALYEAKANGRNQAVMRTLDIATENHL